MVQSSDHRSHAISRYLKVLLPPSPSSSNKLRISDELARHLDGAGGNALVVSPFRRKVCCVEVGWDGDGAFLGRGWPEFVAIGALWFLVFRHQGGGLLTVKVFDTNCCVQEVVFKGVHWIRTWVQLERSEEVKQKIQHQCRHLEEMVIKVFINHGWRFSNRISL